MPAWQVIPPKDEDAIDLLADAFVDSGCDMTAVLRVLFNSEFFKNARYARLKSPAEVVVGTLRLVGGFEFPGPGLGEMARQPTYMGQDLLNPPSVEGWHTGVEWINSGSLMRRINFTADMVSDVNRPGIRSMISGCSPRATSPPPTWWTTAWTSWPAGSGRGHPAGTGSPRPAQRQHFLGHRR